MSDANKGIEGGDSDSVKSLFWSQQTTIFAGLVVALMFAMLPSIVNAMIRAGSTPKDPSVGIVTPVENPTELDLQGKRALVVGGTRGVGRGIALTLAKGGASVTVVGRDTHKIISQIQAVSSPEADQEFMAYSADLSTVGGSRQLVQALADGKTRPFDYVFFTVGCWPTYNIPFTTDGIERVVALDLVAHHVVLTGLINDALLKPGARVMNTIASTQNFPFQSRQSVQKRLTDSTSSQQGPGMIPFTLFPVAIAGDCWLREMSARNKNIKFVGMFPGIVSTELPGSSFPSWMMPLLRACMWPIAISEEASGLAHVTVLTSNNVGRHGVSFFNHLLEGRKVHQVADDELSAWVFDWLENTSLSLKSTV